MIECKTLDGRSVPVPKDALRFYYLCTPRSLVLVQDDEVEDDGVEMPRWVEISGLGASHFQEYGELILSYLR